MAQGSQEKQRAVMPRVVTTCLALLLAVLACSRAPGSAQTPAPVQATHPAATTATLSQDPNPPESTETSTPAATATRAVNVSRIAIRTVGGVAEFYDTGTGERFVPRGVNYVDFYRNERGNYEDRVMATNVYDPERARTAFQRLAEHGYNTVRVFFDTCGSGPYCIGRPDGAGLNPPYLDNMVDLLHIAGETGIYVIFTANSVPEEGGYWPYFDDQVFSRDQRFGFVEAGNADWLHPAGIEIKRRFWTDLMAGMAARQAPFAAVLGWQLTNELWLFKHVPPLSLDEGQVTTANGQTYDLADPAQKRQMVTDGVLHYIEEIVPIIRAHDAEALTTVGFFAPQFPNPTGIGGDWYVDTAPLLAADPPVDFWDFHAYYDNDLTIEQQAENFGMTGYTHKPVVMGETGSGKAYFASAYSAITVGLRWIADSCAQGFDGWLNWGYYPWPDDLPGKPWTFLDQDELLLKSMAPINQPDACAAPVLEAANVAFGQPVTASRQLPDEPAQAAVDGQDTPWNAGDYPPQWIEIDLGSPTHIQRVGMTINQWPPGVTRHQVWARQATGQQVLVAEFNGYTTLEMALAYDLPVALPDVMAVRILTLESPAWVSWREVEVISAPPAALAACVGTAGGSTNLYRWPGRDQPQISSLAVGQAVYVDGAHTLADGSLWRRVGGGLWAEAGELELAGDCDAAELAGQPLPLTAPVTFVAAVPEHTQGEVFMAGSFPGTGLPAWLPFSVRLEPSGSQWTVTLDLPAGSEIEYVYTRNSFETIERPASCGETVPRRVVVANEAMRLDDVVVKWRDLDGCD